MLANSANIFQDKILGAPEPQQPKSAGEPALIPPPSDLPYGCLDYLHPPKDTPPPKLIEIPGSNLKLLPPAPKQPNRCESYIRACVDHGNQWSLAQGTTGYSPVSYCLTPSLQKKRDACHASNRMWVWSRLSQNFECLEPQTYGEFEAAQQAQCKGTWQTEPAPSGGYSLTYCASKQMLQQRQDCYEVKQGKWIWNGTTYRMECYVPPEVTACKAKGWHWVMNGHFPECMSDAALATREKDETDCKRDAGRWGPQGLGGVPGCVRSMPDANKPCQTNEECVSKECLVDRNTKENGICAATDSHFGCFAYFKKGTNGLIGMCVD